MRAFRHSTGPLRHVCLTLATLAVALKILIPPGFMARAVTNDLPFALVLCTSQGAVTVASGEAIPAPGEHDKAPAQGPHESPCIFTGHGLGSAPPETVQAPAVASAAHPYRPLPAPVGLTPGRGLSGPPLPARGPPAKLL